MLAIARPSCTYRLACSPQPRLPNLPPSLAFIFAAAGFALGLVPDPVHADEGGVSDTHGLIRDQKWSSRSSLSPGIQKNADGSVDVYFGPVAPAGRESNWVPTGAKDRFEIFFRLYGPQKPLIDKTWKLPDAQEVA